MNSWKEAFNPILHFLGTKPYTYSLIQLFAIFWSCKILYFFWKWCECSLILKTNEIVKTSCTINQIEGLPCVSVWDRKQSAISLKVSCRGLTWLSPFDKPNVWRHSVHISLQNVNKPKTINWLLDIVMMKVTSQKKIQHTI